MSNSYLLNFDISFFSYQHSPWDSIWNNITQWFGVEGEEFWDYALPNRESFACQLYTDFDLYWSGTNMRDDPASEPSTVPSDMPSPVDAGSDPIPTGSPSDEPSDLPSGQPSGVGVIMELFHFFFYAVPSFCPVLLPPVHHGGSWSRATKRNLAFRKDKTILGT